MNRGYHEELTETYDTGDVTDTQTVWQQQVSGDFGMVTITWGISASAVCVLRAPNSTLNSPFPWVKPYHYSYS